MIGYRTLLAAIAATSALALALAAGWQHFSDAQPCPWCTLQRLVYWAMLAASAIGLAVPASAAGGRRAGALVVALLAAGGAAAAAWQAFFLADAASCALTAADRIMNATGLPELWPFMFAATAPCDQANVPVLGIPMPLWSLALYAASLAAALRAAVVADGRAPLKRRASARSSAPSPR